jgi:hypothetical protein
VPLTPVTDVKPVAKVTVPVNVAPDWKFIVTESISSALAADATKPIAKAMVNTRNVFLILIRYPFREDML